jgi:hypothetical protein
MIKYCVDTNAILDLCYRYYPPALFSELWERIESSILSRQITLVISQHIHDEVIERITLMDYDPQVFESFLSKFKVVTVAKTTYEIELAQLQAELLDITPLSSSIAKNADDLSNICVAKLNSATIITAEQGSQLSITDKSYNRLKIPDTCQHYNIHCHNWLPLFIYIGL